LAPSAVVTISIGAPGVITWNYHGLPAGTPIVLTTTEGLPGGLAPGVTYYVSSAAITINTFTLSATVAGALAGNADITMIGVQSGVQTATAPTTVIWANHGLTPNDPLIFGTNGTLPSPLVVGVGYFVLPSLIESGSFQIAAVVGGAPITMGSSQSGIQTGALSANQIMIGGNLSQTMINALEFLTGSLDAQISLCNYAAAGPSLFVIYGNGGTVGNLFALACSTSGSTVSGAFLSGAGGVLTMFGQIGDFQNFITPPGADPYVFDMRWESYDGTTIVYLFGGTITWTQGITRTMDVTTPTPILASFTLAAGLPIPIGDGDEIICADAGGGPAVLVSAGGVWTRVREDSYLKRAISYGGVTLTPLVDANIQNFSAQLTGNVVISLSPNNAYQGAKFRIVSPYSLGIYSFVVNGFPLLQNQWIEFAYDATALAWAQVGNGSILI
jgi:hypothetical protein